MPAPPFHGHFAGNLAWIANRQWSSLHHLMPSLAGSAMQVLRLVRADAAVRVMLQAFLDDVLADAGIRKLSQLLPVNSRKMRIRRTLRMKGWYQEQQDRCSGDDGS